jgi:hypothetical protein
MMRVGWKQVWSRSDSNSLLDSPSLIDVPPGLSARIARELRTRLDISLLKLFQNLKLDKLAQR